MKIYQCNLRNLFLAVLLGFPMGSARAESHLVEGNSSRPPAQSSEIGFSAVEWARSTMKLLTEGNGSGIVISANAVVGVGAVAEMLQFKDGYHLYCAPTGTIASDLQASAGGYRIRTIGQCDGSIYEGGVLSVGASGTTELVELGFTASVGLGVHSHILARALSKIRQRLAGAEKLLQRRPQGGFAAADEKMRVGEGLLQQIALSLTQVKDTGPVMPLLESMGKAVAKELFTDPHRLLGDRSLKGLIQDVATELTAQGRDKRRSDDDRQWCQLMAAVANELVPALTGCDSVTVGATAGVGVVPISGSLGYTHYSRIGLLSPFNLVESSLTLTRLANMTVSPISSMMISKVCAEPAFAAIAGILEAVGK